MQVLMPAVAERLNEIALEEIKETEQQLSVRYTPGTQTTAGSPPRLRTGRLLVGVRTYQEKRQGQIVQTFISERAPDRFSKSGPNTDVPVILEFWGTKTRGPWPYMNPMKVRLEDTLLDRMGK